MLPVHRQRHFLESEVLQEIEDGQRVGQHRQREVMAAQPECRQADQHRGDAADDHAQRNAQPGRQVPVDQRQGDDVGADAEERGVAERNWPP